jgi:hypothetical protein
LAELCIYTHNARIFFLITKKFKDERITFTALDSFDDVHPTAKVIITTQSDLDRFNPELPSGIITQTVSTFQSPDEILLLSLQYLKGIHLPREVIIAIDPGKGKTGIAIFVNKVFLFSKSVYNIQHVIFWLNTIFRSFPKQKTQIKLGNGYTPLTREFLTCIAGYHKNCTKLEFLLVDETKTSTPKWRKTKNFHSIHEHAAMLIGQRSGEIITADSIL